MAELPCTLPLGINLSHGCVIVTRTAERVRRPRANTKSGARKLDCMRGVWGHAPGNFEILHALKCVLGACEALFRICIEFIHTFKLPSLVSD